MKLQTYMVWWSELKNSCFRDNEEVTHEGQGEYSSQLFSRKAVEVIKNSTHDSDPFFLYLSFQSIHKPIQVPDEYARLYQPYGRLNKNSRRKVCGGDCRD